MCRDKKVDKISFMTSAKYCRSQCNFITTEKTLTNGTQKPKISTKQKLVLL